MAKRATRGGYSAGERDVADLPPPPPSFCAGPADPARLLVAVADALNQCERAGIMVRLAHGTVVTGHGYVLAVGDSRLGARWQARTRLPAPGSDDEEAGRGDHVAG